MNNGLSKVSVVIVSRDRHQELMKAVDSVKALNYPKEGIEIVVVEEADSPQKIEGVKYVFLPTKKQKDFGYARNIGVKKSSGDIVAFTDDDCIVEQDWLKQLMSCFHNDIGAVAGGVMVRDCNAIGHCESILGFPGGGLKKIIESRGKTLSTNQLSTCNCAFRRRVFDEIGYFKENTPFSGEDYDFAQRVCRRYRCLYNPKAVVFHKPRGSLWKIFKWFRRRGICEVYLLPLGTNKPILHIWYNIKTSITLRLILLILVLNIFGLSKLYVYLGLFIIYYWLMLFRYRFQWQRFKSIKILLFTPMVKLVMDLGMDCGRFSGPWILLRRRRM